MRLFATLKRKATRKAPMDPVSDLYATVRNGWPIYIGIGLVLALVAVFMRDQWRWPDV